MSLNPPPIGRNIMNQRKQKGMSLDELARRSGVSKSMLSHIEQDKANPTVIIAWKIARALDVTVQDLIEYGSGNIVEVIRSSDANIITSEDGLCTVTINSPIHMTDNLELYQINFKPGGKIESTPHFNNAEEFLTVIRGELKIASGSSGATLHKGDTARYKADVEHKIENASADDSEAYLVVFFPK